MGLESIEEGLAKATTCNQMINFIDWVLIDSLVVVTQHPDLNPRYVLNKDNFYSFNLSEVVDYLALKRRSKAKFQEQYQKTLNKDISEIQLKRKKMRESLDSKEQCAASLNSLLGLDENVFKINPSQIEFVDQKTRIRFEKGNKASERILSKLKENLGKSVQLEEIKIPCGDKPTSHVTLYTIAIIQM